MKATSTIIWVCLLQMAFCQTPVFNEDEISISNWIDGTLLTPITADSTAVNLAIIIPGSGPTNRNGNQNFLKNNALKKLAEGLSEQGIATFRYDKRTVKQIRLGKVDEAVSFNDFVSDAKAVIQYFKSKNTFNKIYIIGHSQGSLVGMLAAIDNADGFVSLAGAGQNIGDVLIEQVNKSAPAFTEDTKRVVAELKIGKTTNDYPLALSSIFGPQIQEFMMSWMAYNPVEIISAVKIPVLIINGTKDLQVSVNEAKLLSEANKNAQLVIVENMNHVLFLIEGDDLENMKSYNESNRFIAKEVISSIIKFIE